VFVQRERQPARAHRSRGIRVGLVLERVFVLWVAAIALLRLGRSLLDQHGRQDDVHRHLQELALPVLEHRLDEVAGREIPELGDLGLAMLALLLVIDMVSCATLA
jgi:hypothetical protein